MPASKRAPHCYFLPPLRLVVSQDFAFLSQSRRFPLAFFHPSHLFQDIVPSALDDHCRGDINLESEVIVAVALLVDEISDLRRGGVGGSKRLDYCLVGYSVQGLPNVVGFTYCGVDLARGSGFAKILSETLEGLCFPPVKLSTLRSDSLMS